MELEEMREKCIGVQLHWGKKMPIMVMEEAGELIQAISKLMRVVYDSELDVIKDASNKDLIKIGKAKKALTDEIGDMYIALMALEEQLKISDRDIEARIVEKLNKKY